MSYMTVGGKPNTAFLYGSHIPLDDKHRIKVPGCTPVQLAARRQQGNDACVSACL